MQLTYRPALDASKLKKDIVLLTIGGGYPSHCQGKGFQEIMPT
jgi:hypothetical protein